MPSDSGVGGLGVPKAEVQRAEPSVSAGKGAQREPVKRVLEEICGAKKKGCGLQRSPSLRRKRSTSAKLT